VIPYGCSLLSVLKISQYDKSPDGLNLAFISVQPDPFDFAQDRLVEGWVRPSKG